MSYEFRTVLEAERYLVLHAEGLEAFDALFTGPGLTGILFDAWEEAGVLRVSTKDGYIVTRTFKKYAEAARRRIALGDLPVKVLPLPVGNPVIEAARARVALRYPKSPEVKES